MYTLLLIYFNGSSFIIFDHRHHSRVCYSANSLQFLNNKLWNWKNILIDVKFIRRKKGRERMENEQWLVGRSQWKTTHTLAMVVLIIIEQWMKCIGAMEKILKHCIPYPVLPPTFGRKWSKHFQLRS